MTLKILCATCGEAVARPGVNTAFPFCSTRCKLVDLDRWIEGQYGIDPATGKLDLIDPHEDDDEAPSHANDD